MRIHDWVNDPEPQKVRYAPHFLDPGTRLQQFKNTLVTASQGSEQSQVLAALRRAAGNLQVDLDEAGYGSGRGDRSAGIC